MKAYKKYMKKTKSEAQIKSPIELFHIKDGQPIAAMRMNNQVYVTTEQYDILKENGY